MFAAPALAPQAPARQSENENLEGPMADTPIRSASPVPGMPSFSGRAPNQSAQRQPPSVPPRSGSGGDHVALRPAAAVALRLLRERVLACTRVGLGLDDGMASPEFAEVVEGEPAPAFVGRLLSAQNQLAARRAGTVPAKQLRRILADALQRGGEEALDLLSADAAHAEDGVAAIVEALAEFGRRLAALASAGDR